MQDSVFRIDQFKWHMVIAVLAEIAVIMLRSQAAAQSDPLQRYRTNAKITPAICDELRTFADGNEDLHAIVDARYADYIEGWNRVAGVLPESQLWGSNHPWSPLVISETEDDRDEEDLVRLRLGLASMVEFTALDESFFADMRALFSDHGAAIDRLERAQRRRRMLPERWSLLSDMLRDRGVDIETDERFGSAIEAYLNDLDAMLREQERRHWQTIEIDQRAATKAQNESALADTLVEQERRRIQLRKVTERGVERVSSLVSEEVRRSLNDSIMMTFYRDSLRHNVLLALEGASEAAPTPQKREVIARLRREWYAEVRAIEPAFRRAFRDSETSQQMMEEARNQAHTIITSYIVQSEPDESDRLRGELRAIHQRYRDLVREERASW